jgi:hypothetical protein
MKKIYVGNLPFSATEEQVRTLFGTHGAVQSVSLINDRETGRPRGFGFVEIGDEGLAGQSRRSTATKWTAARSRSTRQKTSRVAAAIAWRSRRQQPLVVCS